VTAAIAAASSQLTMSPLTPWSDRKPGYQITESLFQRSAISY